MTRNVGYSTVQIVSSDGHAPGTGNPRLEQMRVAADNAYRDLSAGKISAKDFNTFMARVERDVEAVRTASKTRQKALQYAGSGDSAEQFAANGGAVGGGGKNVTRNVSPLDIDRGELWNMFEAAKRKMPYRCEITTKALNVGAAGAPPVGVKTTGSPISEGPPWPSGLFPPVIQPQLTQELRYEYDRIADHIPTITIDAPSIEYLVHTGNTNPAAVVEELGVKADVGMQIDTQTAVPIKLAALASTSMEALADFDYFSSWVPRELSRALIDAETDQLIMGSGSPGMTGFVATSGVLTRAYSEQDTTGLDTLIRACNDIRVGPAFGHADLIALHPTTWDWLKRSKTSTDAFVLSMMDPGSIGALDNLFGVPVITNTYVPEGTGVVLDSQLAARYFVRQALTIDMNLWGDTQWTTNQISWRAEMRSTLAVLRPTAVCIVTGLYPYSGS